MIRAKTGLDGTVIVVLISRSYLNVAVKSHRHLSIGDVLGPVGDIRTSVKTGERVATNQEGNSLVDNCPGRESGRERLSWQCRLSRL